MLCEYDLFVCAIFWSVFFFFKQKTAYEMRISDWSSDVCSSDLWRVAVWRPSESVGAKRSHYSLDLPSGWKVYGAEKHPDPRPKEHGMTPLSLIVTGMSCAGCEQRI